MRIRLLAILLALLPALCATAKTKAETPEWVSRCKPLEDAIEDVTKSKIYDEKALTRIFQLNRQFATCDDGSYGEGISDVTVKALAQSYQGVVKLASEDKGMLAFILKHIDSTTDLNDLDRVSQNSIHQCPKSRKKICKQIERAAKAASKEAHNAGK